MENRPRAREKRVTEGGKGVSVGQSTGMGQVGQGSAMGSGSGASRGPENNGGGSKIGLIIGLIILLLGGGGAGIGSFLGGEQTQTQTTYNQTGTEPGNTAEATGGTASHADSPEGDPLAAFFGNNLNSSVSGWSDEANTGILNEEVSAEAREKFTHIKGGGADTVTLMVYLCGTDLESKAGMATNDLTEMSKAMISDNVNILVYTGGCKGWKNNVISNKVNQIYKVQSGGMQCLEPDMGSPSMTDPSTLTSFISYCSSNYPADRNMLIFWDHGGGSVSGYGYDEKNPKGGSMSLAGINTALKNAGIRYDFIGFDACLMATVETDLMAANYADYMIASEETEPGVGWYYTNWLTELSKNTSMPTIEIGKNIVDDFVDVCARNCRGQKTTLSVVDLAELSRTVGDDFKSFSQNTTELIKSGEYKAVSDARNNVREFAVSTKIDQVDLVSFARGIGTDAGRKLSDTLLSAVKYNRTSPNMTDAYGISIYFPYRKTSSLSKAVSTYSQIGLDSDYSNCIREFASLELSGQAAGGGSVYNGSMPSPLSVLLGGSGGASAQGLGQLTDMISMLSGMSGASDIFTGRSLSDEDTAEYILENKFDPGLLNWKDGADGTKYIELPEEQWSLVHAVDLNMFYDTGSGYADLGLDNLYSIDEQGRLNPDVDGTWLSIDSQPVAYYHTDTVDDGENYTITGYVPAILNEERVKLILIFDNENPYGYVAGADPDYEETETVARGLLELKDGDTLQFVCDLYSYDGRLDDSHYLGEAIKVDTSKLEISNTAIGGEYIALYRFKDIYDQSYWTDRLS